MSVHLGRLEVETPDHVVLRYDLAGAGNRGFAAMVDFLVALLVTAALGIGFERFVLPSAPWLRGWAMLVVVFVGWAYFIVLEWLWNGQTIGKRMFGLRVISADGRPAGFGALLVRNLIRVVDFLPALYGVGLAAVALSPRSQRLGDLAAGTFVVRAPAPRLDAAAMATLDAGPRRTAAAPAPGPAASIHGLPGEVQRLVREFVAREGRLPAAERAALAAAIAAHLRERLPDAPGGDDVELIYAVARGLRASGER
ncbi:MAG TPA: RDD family protein [Candidatus Limnocylindria bacterium]|nr:RDD family protein [Candidatus Limnocylindria bacterium]